MAKVKILVQGYTRADAKREYGQEKICPTITLVLDKDLVMVVDPGALDDPKTLIDALAKEGFSLNDVNMVAVTHSHIDHCRNVGMFPKARVLEYFGIWNGSKVEDWQENFTNDIQILKTPGHDYTCISLFVKTEAGVVAICGDVFLKEHGPEFDIYASDHKKLEHSRQLVQTMSHWIIPGHGAMYKTSRGAAGFASVISSKPMRPAEKILGYCRKCRRPLRKQTDRCTCQEFLCYHCCECEADCEVCNCKVRR